MTKESHASQVMCQGNPWVGLGRPMCEAVNLKFGLSWRPQVVGDVIARWSLPWKGANREWNQPKRKKYMAANRTKRSWRSEEYFDNRHGDAEFGVCSVGFRSCFCLVFPHYAPFPTFWNGNVYILPLYVISMWSAFWFWFYRGFQLRDSWISGETLHVL